MDWTEKRECVLCDKGGNLLVCSGDGCPISVHKICMGCEANFDDAGNFHCPYCVYKQITAETSRLREKVMLNKKNLSIFLEEHIKDDDHQEPIVEMADKKEEIALKDKLPDENNLVSDNIPNHGGGLKTYQQSKTPSPCDETCDAVVFRKTDVNTCTIMVIYEPKSNPVDTRGLDSVSYKEDTMKGDQPEVDVRKGIKVDKQTGNDNSVDEVPLKDAVISPSLEKKITRKKRSRLVKSNNYGKRRKGERVTKDLEHAAETLVSLHSDSKIDNDNSASSLRHPNGAKKESLGTKANGASTTKTNDNDSIIQPLLAGKHRALWSEEEEDMLKEGVQKFSSVSRKNLPWKKILDFGRHVFDPSRNPSDLKDKWRKIAKPT